MSALESLIATGGEAPMLDSLDFTLPPASTAVVDRRQHVRAYPTSASTLSPGGTRTVRLRLGGDDFVDASSIRIMFTINNLDSAKPLIPLTGPWGLWSQAYLRSNGVELDNIPSYGRFHQQYGVQSALHGRAVGRSECLWNGGLLELSLGRWQRAASRADSGPELVHDYAQAAPLPLQFG